ncbi:hypothetical protein [Anatilimnocola floriformis]|uniref:hypothetical protein n=1 Tax=Anatilimnocola floriformis TaxID=2948575 RepID=UPI0020C38123|nr:hypothetical protein [Anatilimnocola floriformis]
MSDSETTDFIARAENLYEVKLRSILEPKHLHEFVAIEPESGDYFLGQTLSEAVGAARRSYPDRITHTMRVGHAAALHFGMQLQ